MRARRATIHEIIEQLRPDRDLIELPAQLREILRADDRFDRAALQGSLPANCFARASRSANSRSSSREERPSRSST